MEGKLFGESDLPDPPTYIYLGKLAMLPHRAEKLRKSCAVALMLQAPMMRSRLDKNKYQHEISSLLIVRDNGCDVAGVLDMSLVYKSAHAAYQQATVEWDRSERLLRHKP